MDAITSQRRVLGWAGALLAGYFALAAGGLQVLDSHDQAAVIWPAAGLAVGALVIAPPGAWLPFSLAILTANFLAQVLVRGTDLPVAVTIAFAGLVQSALAGGILRAVAGESRPRIGSSRTVAGLFAGAGVAGALAAIGGAGALTIDPGQSFGSAYLGWWLGNAIGMLVVTPVVLAVAQPGDEGAGRGEATALIALSTAVAAGVFLRRPGHAMPLLSFDYVVVPFLLWCAVRAGARATTIASLLLAALATVATQDGRGPFAPAMFDVHQRAEALQGFLATVVLTTLVVGAVVADQRRARARAHTEADRLAAALSAQHRAEADLRTVFERAPIGHAIVEEDGTIGESNAALSAITGYDRGELHGRTVERLLCEDDAAHICDLLAAIRRGETDSGERDGALVHRLGHRVDVNVHLAVLSRGDGGPTRTLLQVVDVSQRKALESRLRALADRDALTGLLNRRSFDQALAAHVARARRYGPDGAVVVLDVDKFKEVNDSRGHHAGDELLVAVAKLLSGRVRATDAVARLGGDEFALLLPRVDRAGADRIVRTLVDSVRDELDVTISLGVAMVGHAGADTASDVMIAADRAMYEAKSAGRDGHAFAAPPV